MPGYATSPFDRDGGADIIPSGNLVNGEHVARLQRDVRGTASAASTARPISIVVRWLATLVPCLMS